MPDGMDWVFRPVHEKLINYRELLDGSIGLEDLALLNESLDVKYENQARIEEALRTRG